jgi:hypothetical protein
MADCKNNKTDVSFVGQCLASKLNFSFMMIVTDIIKCYRLTTKTSEVTNGLIKNAIEFVTLPALERTETKKKRAGPKSILLLESRLKYSDSIRFSSCCCLLSLQMFLPRFLC